MSDNEEIPVDDLVTVSCPLFRQLLNAYSEDAATDDYIYYLGEALRQASRHSHYYSLFSDSGLGFSMMV